MQNRLRRKRLYKEIFVHFVVIVFLICFVFPLFWMAISSIKPAGLVFASPPVWSFKPSLENYKEALGIGGRGWNSNIPAYFVNTVIVAVTVTFSNLIIGATAGYGMARYKLGGNKLPLLFLFGRMLPAMVLVLPFFMIFKNLRLGDNLLSLIIAYTAINLPFCVWMTWSFFLDFPNEIEEAAMVDGCNKFQSVIHIVIPLSMPSLISVGILIFVACWNEFLFASTIASVSNRTLPVAASLFITDEAILWGPMTATCMIIMAVPAIITILLQKYIVSGISLGALKG